MEWFKKQLQLIEENEKRLLNSRKEIQEKIAKIEELLPEEKVCVYLYGKVHGFDNQGIEFPAFGNDWLEKILDFANKRTINELKDESIWEGDDYKNYMSIAQPLIKEFGYDSAIKAVDIVFSVITRVQL